MKTKLTILILFIQIILCINNCYAIQNKTNDNFIRESFNENYLNELKYEIEILKRNQINYIIEKELLKETYSVNFGTVNIIATLILSFFTILFTIIGSFGIRYIETTKKNFDNELKELTKIRIEFESKLREIEKNIELSITRIEEVNDENMKQDQRLKILEIQEAVALNVKNEQFAKALEYIEIGLNINKTDIHLNESKAFCLFRLGRIDEAILCYEEIISSFDHTSDAIFNLAEAYLIQKKFDKFIKFYTVHKNNLQKSFSEIPEWYFKSVYFFMNDKYDEFITTISVPPQIKNKFGAKIEGWNYDEMLTALNSKKDSPYFEAMIATIHYLSGSIDFNQLEKAILKIKSMPH